MKRVGFLLRVRPDRLDEYKARHQTVWPDMLEALRETGWRNYSLFLRSDGMLFGYFETEDYHASLQGMATREVNARWQASMEPFFESLNGRPDESFELLEHIFYLE